MKLAENVAMLSVPVNFNPEFVLNIVLLWDNDNLVLIDAGYAGQEDAIAEAIKNTGHDIKDLTHIIVTHQDLDHIGCINSLRKVAPNVKVLAHVDEAPYIDGRKVAVKVEEALKRLETSPLEAQKEIKEYAKRYEEARTKIDQELVDGEILPICGGIKVIHVPGHTPGHIVLHLEESGIMVCGDAANIKDGEITGPNPIHTQDMELGMKSLEKIKSYDMAGLVAYHGGFLGFHG